MPTTPVVALTATGADRTLNHGEGVLRLAPAWVPRVFSTPGRRLRLHPDDLYAFGKDRGGIDERWLASPIRADNGPSAGAYEGLSLVVDPDGGLLPFDELIAHLGSNLIGSRIVRGPRLPSSSTTSKRYRSTSITARSMRPRWARSPNPRPTTTRRR